MPDRHRPPRRFRRRLTAAFVLVAAISAGLVAVVTVVLTRESRWRSVRASSLEEARFALAVAPSELDEDNFERFLAVYERRSDANILATRGDRLFVSSAGLDLDDVPAELSDPTAAPVIVDSRLDGQPVLVVGAVGRDNVRYYLFFSTDELRRSLDELTRLATISWLATVVLAGAVGNLIARRTLRPVANVATAAEAIAAGDRTTRLPAGATDEFGLLATSFNHMVDELHASLDQLAAAAQRERQFTADVAHELRTPLTGMSASAALLRDQLDALPQAARSPAEILVGDVARLRQLVLELLELASLDATNETPPTGKLNLLNAVESVVSGSAWLAAATIRVDVDPHTSVTVDAFGLRRILSNILENAVVHGNGSPVHVTCSTDASCVRLSVADRGPGIAPGDLDRIFHRFFKTDASRSRPGSGLGLAIARQYADRSGGALTVASTLGHGTTFTLLLPLAPGEFAPIRRSG